MLENFYSEATNGFNHQLNLQLKVGHRPEQANTNLLVFLAFYVIELRSRVDGLSRKIIRFEELNARDPQAAQIYGAVFESAMIEQSDSGSQFLPLVSICERLFNAEAAIGGLMNDRMSQ